MLERAILLATLVVLGTACSKQPDAATGAADSSASSATSSIAASTAPPSAGDGTPQSFASGFEGTIVMHTTGAHGPSDMLFLTKGGKLRVDVPGPDGRTAHTILDPASSKMLIVMDSQQMVMQMPMPSSPPAATAGAAPTVTRTGKHETIAGYDCEDWEIASGGKHTSACVALGLTFFDFSAMAGPTSARSWAAEVRDKNGFPLRAVETDATGKETTRMEVTKIEKRALTDAAFAAPPGFNVMPVPGMVMGTGGGRPGASPH